MDWPASMKREPTKGIFFGTFRATFESTTLREVQKAASAGVEGHSGEGGERIYWLCYTAPRRGAVDKIWIISHGEMGGPEGRITAFAASRLANPTTSSDCPALPASMLPVSIDVYVWLGSSDAELGKHLGAPSHAEGSWKIYNFQTKVPGDCIGGYDMGNFLFTNTVGGYITSLYAGQVTSC